MEKEEGDCGYGTSGGSAAGRGMEQASSDVTRSTVAEAAEAIAPAAFVPCGACFDEVAAQAMSCSSAARRRLVQKISMACSSSPTGGRDGAMRMLESLGSMP